VKKYIILFALIFCSVLVAAQQKLSEKATISVITCGAGNELYTAFGHSAFRIYDPVLKIDKVYNYGTFDFNVPNFYLNFIEGNLMYQLSTTTFSRFLSTYYYENRWVKTQELNLNTFEVQEIFNFLENNAKPENKLYQYDFFYNNCSTKIENVIVAVLKDKVTFNNNHITTNKTHRDLIADYTANFKWAKFGIDLALGSVIDNKATKDAYKFLPDYIYQAFDNATISNKNETKPLVKSKSTLLKSKKEDKPLRLIQPLPVFSMISILLIWFTYRNYKSNKRSKWIDFTLYFTTGFIGIVVLLLWFATAHTATYKNFNFLWAFAPNLIVAFYMLKSKLPKWLMYYNLLLSILVVLMLLLWVFKIQVFNNALLPVIFALILRYYYLILQNKKQVIAENK